MMREKGVCPNGTENTSWRERVDQMPTFHYHAEDDAEEHVTRNIHRGNGRIQDLDGVQSTRRRAHREPLKHSYARARGRLQT